MTLILFISFLSGSISIDYTGGLTGGEAYRLVLPRDIYCDGLSPVKVLEVKDSRGRISGAHYSTKIYLNTGPAYKGALMEKREDRWVLTGCYQSRTEAFRANRLQAMENLIHQYCSRGELARTLILGKPSWDIQRIFRRCGLSFLLALSGLHIAIILQFFSPCLYGVPKKFQDPLRIILLFGFLWLTGFRHSLFRALLMFLMRYQEKSSDKRTAPPLLLIRTALVHLLLFPEAIGSLSFQLSYAAMMGILIITPRLAHLFRHPFPLWLSNGLTLSAGAQLAINPLLIWYFGELHPFSLFSSLILAPLITFYIWFGLLFFLVPLAPLRYGLAWIMDRLEWLLIQWGELLGRIPSLKTGASPGKCLLWVGLSLLPIIYFSYSYIRGVLPHERAKSQPQLRFPHRNKDSSGYDGAGSEKTLGAELSH